MSETLETLAWEVIREIYVSKIKTCDAIDKLQPELSVQLKMRVLNRVEEIVFDIKKNA
jgi:aspartokinase-like uncharacterized kinase